MKITLESEGNLTFMKYIMKI